MGKFNGRAKCLAVILVAGCAVAGAMAQSVDELATQQLRRAQEREAQQRERLQPRPDVRLPAPQQPPARTLPPDEAPCFPIHRLELEGDASEQFGWLKNEADGHAQLDEPDPALGRCLGAQGIQVVIQRLQHALIARGFVTTRVLAGAQNLQSGTLVLTVLPGRVGDIHWAEQSGDRGSRWNTVPAQAGELLNVRDLEQALENYQRAPTAEADIRIAPGREPGTSDLVIAHRQAWPFRVAATLDDSGSRSTGKRQASLTLSYDNALNLSDLFYISLLRDLGGSEPGERGTRGHVAHYSVPWGYWLLAITNSANRFHQTVAGASQDYVYSGTSRITDAKATRVVHRDASSKSTASLRSFQRTSRNFIDDAEVEVQRRTTGGLEWGANHRRVWPGGTFEASASYRRGTGAWGSLKSPEEDFGEGTSRLKLWLLEARLHQAFDVAGRRWAYHPLWRAQFDRTPLTPQERFAIGGRYTVRGFDGLSTLAGERGWVLRNELSTMVAAGHQAFFSIDRGHVGGPSAGLLVGTQLTGAVMGLRGQTGAMSYELFIGRPVSRPANFQTADTTAGFSLAWTH